MTRSPYLQDAETLKALLTGRLDQASASGRQIAFWWRDDDAVAATQRLESILSIRRSFSVPLSLAVIPDKAHQSLADRLRHEPAVYVLQHGYAHSNHAATGELKSEFPSERPAALVREELSGGASRLSALFGDRFLPVLTPPWNRIGDNHVSARGTAGLPGFSTYKRKKPYQSATCNTQLDLIAWRRGRVFAGRKKCYRRLLAEADRRCRGHDEAIGILSHHLVHDAATTAFLFEVLALLTDHPGAVWPQPGSLFDLP